MSKPIKILLTGLSDSQKVYMAGDIEENPSPRLVELASGEKLAGMRVAEFVDEKPPDNNKPPEPKPQENKKEKPASKPASSVSAPKPTPSK